MYSLIIPVYKNEFSIPELIEAVEWLNRELRHQLEAVFVVDGSPDNSGQLLSQRLPVCSFCSTLIFHSRNFGSFAAIRTGLSQAKGDYFAVMAADLQEPISFVKEMFKTLARNDVDVVIGSREKRGDPLLSRWASELFWFFYRKLVQKEIPPGGVDIFGCNQNFRLRLLELHESNSTLVGLLFWLGFRRKILPYQRQPRQYGRSAWTLARKVRYLVDSVFAFSDLPITLMVSLGLLGVSASVLLALTVLIARLSGHIHIPGYSATVLIVMFFGGLNSLGLGIIGSYLWRTFENTKRRPSGVVSAQETFNAHHE